MKCRLEEVKNNGKLLNRQPRNLVAIAYRRWSFTSGSNCQNCEALTGKILVFWRGGRLWELVAHRSSTVTHNNVSRKFWQRWLPSARVTVYFNLHYRPTRNGTALEHVERQDVWAWVLSPHLDSGIREIFACKIRSPWNSTLGFRNLANDWNL